MWCDFIVFDKKQCGRDADFTKADGLLHTVCIVFRREVSLVIENAIAHTSPK